MRVMCVLFHRLPIALASSQRPHLAGRPIILVSGAGQDGLVTATASSAARDGVVLGMSAAEARRLVPSAPFLPDNAAACLDTLDHAAALVRGRFTPLVELGGRDHLFLALPPSPRPDHDSATAILTFLAAWTGHELRAGVADTREAALAAARCARNGLAVEPTSGTSPDSIRPYRDDTITLTIHLTSAQPIPGQLTHAAQRLATLLTGRSEGARTLAVSIGDAPPATIRSRSPLYDASAILDAFAIHAEDAVAGDTITITLGALAPDVRIRPFTLPPRVARTIPRRPPVLAHPVLLRAAG